MNSAKRQAWRRRLSAIRHLERRDGMFAVALLALPWILGWRLARHHHLDPTAVGILVPVSIGLSTLWLTWVGVREAKRSVTSNAEQLAPHERRERKARDQLRHYLARQDRLTRMDKARALALGVKPAIDLPQPTESAAAPGNRTDSRPARQRRRFLPRPWRGRPSKPRTLDQEPELPAFVDRDNGPEIASWLRRAREDGGFLMLVGDSSVGKTRLLYETARDVLPDFAVLVPDPGDGSLVNSIAAATFPIPKLIVWLDELQRFLDGLYLTPGSTPITATAVRHLLDAPTPVVILGTMWPEHATQLRATEPDPDTSIQRPRYPGAADVLRNGRIRQETLTSFSDTEREAAAKLASNDPRLAAALADPHYNVTEALAGAPRLVARYQQASEEQRAVLDAAIDARRLGIQAPLTGTLLRPAARGYLRTLHRDDIWFGRALDELTECRRPQDHATAPLIPVPNEEKTGIVGYTVAGYLMQHVSRKRRSARVSAGTWDAFVSHVRDPADTARLADSARNRLLYRYAIPLYRYAVNAGVDDWAPIRLAELLRKRAGLAGVRAPEPFRNSDNPRDNPRQQVDLLVDCGDLDGLRARADAGDGYAARRLADLLADRGDLDGAEQILRARANVGDRDATRQLAGLLLDRGDLDGADQILRALAPDGWWPGMQLVNLLVDRGDLDGLRARADAGDDWAALQLAELVAKRGDLDGLRALADAGNGHAAQRLASLLADRGDLDGLRARADAGDGHAAERMADLRADQLAVQGQGEEAERLRRFGLNPNGSIASE